jgi:hypothetical protein
MRSIIVIAALVLGFGALAPRYLSKIGPAPAPAAQEVRTTVPAPVGGARPRSVAIATPKAILTSMAGSMAAASTLWSILARRSWR